MNDSSNFRSYCGMMGYTEIKLQILIAKLINLTWFYLMDFKRLRKIANNNCYLRHFRLSVRVQNSTLSGTILNKFDNGVSFEEFQIF